MGFEPTTHGTTIRYSNQLSYGHHVWGGKFNEPREILKLWAKFSSQVLLNYLLTGGSTFKVAVRSTPLNGDFTRLPFLSSNSSFTFTSPNGSPSIT